MTKLSTDELFQDSTREEMDDFLANGDDCAHFKRRRLIRKLLALALESESGLDDVSYSVGRTGGHIPSYAGYAKIQDEGRTWVAHGFRAQGCPDACLRRGRVEFTLDV